ncbi:MAG TPA: hypothetical protein PLL00_11565 [Bacteroidia bacterium]|jgi:hypothetical protein|nr:hypothetical protein [Bacteroidia bacterium]
MKLLASAIIFMYLFLSTPENKELKFTVFHEGKNIGTMKVTKRQDGGKVIRELKTDTDRKVMVASIHVESDVSIVSDEEIVTMGMAYRYGNPSTNDVHSNVMRLGSKYQIEQNGVVRNMEVSKIEFCMVDLYFKEPKGVTTVFSNMHSVFLPIKKTGEGEYQVQFPDDKTAIYKYKEGEIDVVESNTPYGIIISRRKWKS